MRMWGGSKPLDMMVSFSFGGNFKKLRRAQKWHAQRKQRQHMVSLIGPVKLRSLYNIVVLLQNMCRSFWTKHWKSVRLWASQQWQQKYPQERHYRWHHFTRGCQRKFWLRSGCLGTQIPDIADLLHLWFEGPPARLRRICTNDTDYKGKLGSVKNKHRTRNYQNNFSATAMNEP